MDLNLDRAWNDTFGNVINILPRIALFLLVLLVGWIVAKVFQRITDAVLERVGFDRAVERGGVGRSLERSRYDASDIVAKIVYFSLILVTLVVAFNVFGPNPVSALLASVIAWLPQLFVAVILVVVAAFIANFVRDIMTATLSEMAFGRFLAMAAYVFILGLGIIAALTQVGVATAVTLPVLVFVLATIGGVVVVGVGGGLVRPMQTRWDRWLSRAEQEAQSVTPLRTREQREAIERTKSTLPPAAQM